MCREFLEGYNVTLLEILRLMTHEERIESFYLFKILNTFT